ncbi:Na+/H+ antiporter NhaA [Veillonella agrestimuris]|uniref:Na+/H+ antiporter NhaA n=1 Tax=Veillonella agrestimuris TaxID=2941340 RepID=UPI00204082F2|nr:Na+/H+ antiporter NhaA [Veillonella agrestimuris]
MNKFKTFLQSDSIGGVSLLLAAILGVIVANSSFASVYFNFMQIHLGPLTLLEWVNDGLMALFFLYVGLEIKTEMISGELNTNSKRLLPVLAAIAGVLAPALIYFLIAGVHPDYTHGWAIPTATDIAFAIGIITMLGKRVSQAMKAFLSALAVIDDLIAIIVIAIFYGAGVNLPYLLGAVVTTALLVYTNKQGYLRPILYVVLGVVLWTFVLRSGVHATIAGVVLAMTIPAIGKIEGRTVYPLHAWAHKLKHWVNLLIIPVFSFLNAGVSFSDFSSHQLFHPVVLGISLGLILGKQFGIFSAVYILVQSKIIKMPTNTSWIEVYGTSIVCGIGFTMSLFVATLAFAPGLTQEMAKVGIFIGSIVSGLLGASVLFLASALKKNKGNSSISKS